MKLQRVVLKEYPKGELQAEHMAIIEEAVPELAEDQVLLQVEHLSIDAFIRTTFNEGAFHGTADLGQPIVALGIGESSTLDSTDSIKVTRYLDRWAPKPMRCCPERCCRRSMRMNYRLERT